jgi:hypothetical protein
MMATAHEGIPNNLAMLVLPSQDHRWSDMPIMTEMTAPIMKRRGPAAALNAAQRSLIQPMGYSLQLLCQFRPDPSQCPSDTNKGVRNLLCYNSILSFRSLRLRTFVSRLFKCLADVLGVCHFDVSFRR